MKSARSNLSYWKLLQKETKMLKSGTKNALFGHFWASFLKNIVIFEISTLELCLIAKFCKKRKIPKFRPKNALFHISVFLGWNFQKAIVIF